MSKKLFLIPFVVVILSSFLQGKSVKLQGTITNSSAYKYIYLYEFYGAELLKKDSALLNKGGFIFNSKDGFPRGFYQLKFNDTNFFNIILGDESPLVTADLNNLNTTLKIQNSRENDVYATFKSFLEVQNMQMRNLQNEAGKVQALQTSDPAGFQVKMTALQARYDSLTNIQQDFYKNTAGKNKDLFIGKFINQLVLSPEHTKENYITAAELNDSELLRSDVLISKLSNYFSYKFTEQTMEGVQASINSLIERSTGTKGQELLFVSMINMFGSVDMDLTASIAEQYAKSYPKSEKSKKIIASMPKASPKVGEPAPDIQLPDPEGKNVSLASLKGKVVLLDFWASWCGPCRMENPNVVNVFNKYKDKGFTIYSVSLDGDKNKWLQAIEKDKLTWTHVSDLKNWNSAGAALYGVRSIPATYLIGKDGKIIAKNLRGEKLEEELKKVLEIN